MVDFARHLPRHCQLVPWYHLWGVLRRTATENQLPTTTSGSSVLEPDRPRTWLAEIRPAPPRWRPPCSSDGAVASTWSDRRADAQRRRRRWRSCRCRRLPEGPERPADARRRQTRSGPSRRRGTRRARRQSWTRAALPACCGR